MKLLCLVLSASSVSSSRFVHLCLKKNKLHGSCGAATAFCRRDATVRPSVYRVFGFYAVSLLSSYFIYLLGFPIHIHNLHHSLVAKSTNERNFVEPKGKNIHNFCLFTLKFFFIVLILCLRSIASKQLGFLYR